MPKKKQHGAILSCDPSFRNCAFVLHYPAQNIEIGETYDLTQDFKRYDGFPKIVVLIYDLLVQVWEDFAPHLGACTVFAVETQYHKSMERLVNCLTSAFYVKFRECYGTSLKMLGCSAKYWRKHYKITKGNYRERKLSSVTYVNSNPQLLCASLATNDDNRCEAILILNYAVTQHGLEFSSTEMNRTRGGPTRRPANTGGRSQSYDTTRVYVADGNYVEVDFVEPCVDCQNKNYYIALSQFDDNLGQPYYKCSTCKKSGGVLDYNRTMAVKEAVERDFPEQNVIWYPPKKTSAVGKQRPAPRKKQAPVPQTPAHPEPEDSIAQDLWDALEVQRTQITQLQTELAFIKNMLQKLAMKQQNEGPVRKKPKLYCDEEPFPDEMEGEADLSEEERNGPKNNSR